jgi:hypothetical protein
MGVLLLSFLHRFRRFHHCVSLRCTSFGMTALLGTRIVQVAFPGMAPHFIAGGWVVGVQKKWADRSAHFFESQCLLAPYSTTKRKTLLPPLVVRRLRM